MDTNTETETTISAEQRLRNVAAVVMKHTEVKRYDNGRGRCRTYAANVDAIAQSARQLAEMVEAYLENELEAVDYGHNPF